ncbi:MAG: aminoacylase [Acidimicrobiaceae bacterium]|jgi:N-acyl-D-aspartate/D-glutamate deacylase|nr:aminoacylase [Acidimicrobiaceae bacterium]|tara:strand:- start:3827 stop:5545 length:1719 start_codon:yes stop_codon:yes gene_type:complete
MFDVVLKGGEVIDGTGKTRFKSDIGVSQDRITAIGNLESSDSGTVIDASGKLVCPGFVDVHTHLDAQVFWDGTLSPSPLHGVTTVIGGNCGFTIAPLSDDPAVGDYLMRMLSRVEGIPLECLQEGVPWNWKSTAEYFDSMEGRLSINAGFKVGHSALRRVVMGTAATEREATDEELKAMQELLRLGLESGGIGFSSSWSRTHNDPFGNMVPSRYASRGELIALCEVLADFEGTSIEFIPALGPFEQWAMDLMADMSVAANSPLNWNVLNINARTLEEGKKKLEAGDVATSKGGKVIALTVPMTLGLHLNFLGGFVLDALPEWENFILKSRHEKMEILSDPVARKELDDFAQQDSPLRNVAHWGAKTIFHTKAPENKQYVGKTIYEIADEVGKSPWDTLVDIALADELETSFGNPVDDEPDTDWEARVEVWRDSRAIIGASDAGAHLDLFISSNYATYMLGEAVRKRNLLDMEEAVHMLTKVPAELYGLVDRGVIKEGNYADLVVFDENTIGSEPTSIVNDLPLETPRLFAGAYGVEHVLCNGEEIVRSGEFTSNQPGTVLRSGTHTKNPSMV